MGIASRRLQRAHYTSSTGGNLDSLARVPWEGGSEYWSQFSKTANAGWANDSFFPIVSFSNAYSDASEIAFDKDHGINVYYGLNPWTPYTLLTTYNMYYIGESYTYETGGTTMPSTFPNWVGYYMPDEIDGTSSDGPTGLATVTSLSNADRANNDGRFISANYTRMVIMTGFSPYGSQFINHSGVDQVSLDQYWYTTAESGFAGPYVSDVGGPTNYRSATSYGAAIRGMRQLDAADSSRKPIWSFVEMLCGSPWDNFVRYIEPLEMKGAVMSSIINEARGILWFNNVASQDHAVGNVLRTAQAQGTNFVGHAQVEAMGEINNYVRSLASVINTQSYVWSFGANLETMLKAYGGYAYIFAMCSNGSTPGSRTFTLPAGITGTIVEVFDESRNITVSGGSFSDTFAAEYAYHIYKIAL